MRVATILAVRMSDESIKALIPPLTLRDLILVLDLYKHRQPDCPDEKINAIALTKINANRSNGDISPKALLAAIARVRLFHPDLFRCVSVPLLKQLTVCAQPAVHKCCNCGCDVFKVEQQAWSPFFYDASGPPSKGHVYHKTCTKCRTRHTLNGFYAHGQKAADEILYSKDNRHPKWFLASRETVVDRQLFKEFDENFYHMHAGFEPACKAHNHKWGLGKILSKAVLVSFWISVMPPKEASSIRQIILPAMRVDLRLIAAGYKSGE